MHGLSLVAASGGYSSLWCMGFSLRWLLLLRSTGSRHMGFSSCGTQALERRLSSCGTRASLLHSMWDVPGPGLEAVSPALAGGFLTTAPPGKSQGYISRRNESFCVQVFVFEGERVLTTGQELVCTFPVPVSLTNILKASLSSWGQGALLPSFLASFLNLVYMAPTAWKHLSCRDGAGVA